jgi:hypothetical protein
MGLDTYHEVPAVVEGLLGEVAALALLEDAHALAQVPVAPHNADLQHGGLAAFAPPERPSPDFRVLFHLFAAPHLLLGLALLLQRQEDGGAELVRRQLLVHAPHETVAVPLVAEVLFDQVDLLVGPAHE